MNIKERVQERANDLPLEVWDCEGCRTADSMEVRRSSLNEQFYADDILLKCMNCWHTRSHGIPFEDSGRFEEELSERDGRVVDFARDGHDPREQLEALGYLGKASTHE